MSAALDIAGMNARRIESLRKALLARNRKIAKLDRFKPTTGLGKQALVLSQQLAAVSAALQAVTTYTTMIITTTVQAPTFTTSPASTPGIPVSDLQSAYQTFEGQWNAMQGTASGWINTNPNSSVPSILSQLTSVPASLTGIDPSVQYYLSLLQSLPPGSQGYKDDLTKLQGLIASESTLVAALASRVGSFAASMQTQTDSVVAQVTTGVIAEVIQAYQSQIYTLNQNIQSLNDQISSNDTKLIEDYAAIGAASIVTLVGMALWYLPPVGFSMIAAGAYGIYDAAIDIEALNAQNAADSAQITTETNVAAQDTSEMSNLQLFAGTVQGYTALNATAQQELATLAAMYNDLVGYLGTMNTELTGNEIATAAAEWNEIMQGANSLAAITLYVWPSNAQLFAPSTLSLTSSGVYVIVSSGAVYYCANGASTWTAVSDRALSVIATDGAVIKINGAPANGSTSQNPYTTDYTVCRYNQGANTWTALSTFPASNITTDGANIYCTQQSSGTANQYVYQYSGSGTTWTQLPALPNGGIPRYLAMSGGALFVATFNQGIVYKYTGSSWFQVSGSSFIAVALTGGNNYVGFIDQNQKGYLYYVQTAQSPPAVSGSSVIAVAEATAGVQYQISAAQALSYVQVVGGSPQATPLQQNAVAMVTAYNSGRPAYCDNKGNLYALNGNPSPGNNSWTQLPALPAAS